MKFALRLTARTSFVFWFLTFVGGPLATIHQAAAPSLLRWRPRLGLAFAGAHLVHMSIVIGRALLVPGTRYSWMFIIFGGAGAIVVAIMALTSFSAVRKRISPRGWKRFHRTGIWYVGIMFSYGFLLRPFSEATLGDPLYWPFTTAILIAFAAQFWRMHLLSETRAVSRGVSA